MIGNDYLIGKMNIWDGNDFPKVNEGLDGYLGMMLELFFIFVWLILCI